jgi:acyl-CoA reductase-like NAD-dependent aldehyde dehydrogenase
VITSAPEITEPDTGRTLIGGRWVRTHGKELPVYAPATGMVIATVPRQGRAEVDAAVDAARGSAAAWEAYGSQSRAAVLDELADRLAGEADRLAELITTDVGTPRRVARSVQVDLPITVLRTTAARLRALPWTEHIGTSVITATAVGVVGAITPWNYPLHQSIAKIAGAWAAGCPVVHKPSELAPLAVLRLAELIADLDVPAGVYNQLSGLGPEVGQMLAEHPDVDHLSFTGSPRVGRQVAAAAGAQLTAVTLELGGKSAAVVLPGADLAAGVKATVGSALLNSGQTCSALTRLLVPRADYEQAVQLAGDRAAELEPRLGPLISAEQRERVVSMIAQAQRDGARTVVGGPERPDRGPGYWVRATVLADVPDDAAIASEEVFGPVLCVIGYDDEDEARRIANDTPYGLAAAVWGADQSSAVDFARGLRAGQIDINGAPFNPEAPFGGYGASGIGRELGEYGIRTFLTPTAMQLPPMS